jgi:hypothetical protein
MPPRARSFFSSIFCAIVEAPAAGRVACMTTEPAETVTVTWATSMCAAAARPFFTERSLSRSNSETEPDMRISTSDGGQGGSPLKNLLNPEEEDEAIELDDEEYGLHEDEDDDEVEVNIGSV